MGAHDRSLAFTYADVSSVATAAGAIGLAAAAALWLTAPPPRSRTTRLVVAPGVADNSWAVVVQGAW
jgi:hypothetical protein